MGALDGSTEHCCWPALPAPYAATLQAAVEYVLEHFPVYGIVASGTVVAGKPDANSDIDLYVIHRLPIRQRIQRRWHATPVEIFVNPPGAIRRYFRSEREKPSTAFMLAQGFVILDCHPVVEELRAEAAEWLARAPELPVDKLTLLRYAAADAYENAQDIRQQDPENALLLLHSAIQQMVEYAFLSANRPLPRHKDTLAALAALDPELAQVVRTYYRSAPSRRLGRHFDLAARIAQDTIHTSGFFEWESNPDPLPEEDAIP
jgi:hypothetical protein